PFLGEDARRLRVEARDSARELSGARDAQSAAEALADLTDDAKALTPRTVASIRARLDALRANAEAATLTQAVRARLIIALDAAGSAVDAWPLDAISFTELARELTETYKLGRDDAPRADWRS